MTVDPIALVYAGLQVWKLYKDDARFDAEMAVLKAKGLDDAGILNALHDMRVKASQEAHDKVRDML